MDQKSRYSAATIRYANAQTSSGRGLESSDRESPGAVLASREKSHRTTFSQEEPSRQSQQHLRVHLAQAAIPSRVTPRICAVGIAIRSSHFI